MVVFFFQSPLVNLSETDTLPKFNMFAPENRPKRPNRKPDHLPSTSFRELLNFGGVTWKTFLICEKEVLVSSVFLSDFLLRFWYEMVCCFDARKLPKARCMDGVW